jgi:hypothetical protein
VKYIRRVSQVAYAFDEKFAFGGMTRVAHRVISLRRGNPAFLE